MDIFTRLKNRYVCGLAVCVCDVINAKLILAQKCLPFILTTYIFGAFNESIICSCVCVLTITHESLVHLTIAVHANRNLFTDLQHLTHKQRICTLIVPVRSHSLTWCCWQKHRYTLFNRRNHVVHRFGTYIRTHTHKPIG